jgi:uncharacterized membrane protein
MRSEIMLKLRSVVYSFLIVAVFALPYLTYAKEVSVTDVKTDLVKAVVVSIDKTTTTNLGYVDVPSVSQTITAVLLSGDSNGKEFHLVQDNIILKVGDKFFVDQTLESDGTVLYSFSDIDRLNSIIFFLVLFIVILLIFGGWQGIRALVSLVGSLALIVYVLLPGILHGFSPILLSLGVSSVIIIVGSFVTHGFNKTTLSAVIGMTTTIMITGILASIAVHTTHLTGYSSEESVYLASNAHGTINLAGLLLGGILIGLLGVLYDIAIGQAISVEELIRANTAIDPKTLYQRASRIGKEHIGALVNTLAIAYVGVSLPLLLLFFNGANGSAIYTINMELFSTEIIRTLIGSIGLILAVPITTIITVMILTRTKKLPHTHGHSHT